MPGRRRGTDQAFLTGAVWRSASPGWAFDELIQAGLPTTRVIRFVLLPASAVACGRIVSSHGGATVPDFHGIPYSSCHPTGHLMSVRRK